ncbi:hypothetical protein Plhal304r1_c016g0058901 [Plasmopara halstedii]
MLLLVSLRNVIIVFVGIYTCSAYISVTRREEEPHRISRSSITKHSTAPNKNDSFVIPENSEARGRSAEEFVAEISDELSRTNVVDRLKVLESPLHGATNSIKTATSRVGHERFRVKKLLKQNDWRVKLAETDVSWNDELIRNSIFNHCLKSRESPMYLFHYMKIRLPYSPNDLQSIDPKLLWWFQYIILYRLVEKSTAKDAATSDTASSHNGFGNKELFSFLVSEYRLPTGGMETSSAIIAIDPISIRHVLTLIQLLRKSHDMTITDLARQMQKYLLTRSDTKELVLQTWLKDNVSPIVIFDFLGVKTMSGLVGDEDALALCLWYVRMYWDVWCPGHVNTSFKYSTFLALFKKMSSDDTVKTLFTDSRYKILDKEVDFGFGSHLKNLKFMSIRSRWLLKDYKPQTIFRSFFPSGEFTDRSHETLQVIAFINQYRSQDTFTKKAVFKLLSPANSVKKIVDLF